MSLHSIKKYLADALYDVSDIFFEIPKGVLTCDAGLERMVFLSVMAADSLDDTTTVEDVETIFKALDDVVSAFHKADIKEFNYVTYEANKVLALSEAAAFQEG